MENVTEEFVRVDSTNPAGRYYPIGTIELLAEREFTNYYETAAWHQTVKCPPQTAELSSNGYFLSFGFDGAISDEYFPALWGGVPVTSGKRNNVGRPGQYAMQTYVYDAGALIDRGDLYRVTLAPEFEFRTEILKAKDSDREIVLTKLYRRANQPQK